MIFGAHIKISKGFDKAILQAKKMGLSAIQIFASAPQNWNPSHITNEQAENFAKKCQEAGIKYIFFHGIYLINLASENKFLLENSKKSLISYLNINAKMKGNGVIFHLGSTKGQDFAKLKPQIIKCLDEILAKSDSHSTLILETSAGSGNNIGDTFLELAGIYKGIKNKVRIGFCLDTAHTFASGYDWRKNPVNILKEFDKIIGLAKLVCLHINDSKSGLFSHVDRHENVGHGKLGDETFRKILHLPQIQKIPLILEVPGFDNKGPDLENIKKLKELAH